MKSLQEKASNLCDNSLDVGCFTLLDQLSCLGGRNDERKREFPAVLVRHSDDADVGYIFVI